MRMEEDPIDLGDRPGRMLIWTIEASIPESSVEEGVEEESRRTEWDPT